MKAHLDALINSCSQCRISSRPFIMYYLILLFLLCFATPVLITTSLNVFIQSAVRHTTYEVVSHHQWLTLVRGTSTYYEYAYTRRQ